MAKELKTKKTDANVRKFIDTVEDEQKRDDAYTVLKLMQKITKEEPKMWGSAIVGFGTYSYKYASGQQGDWPLVGFSPRKQNLTLYIMPGFEKYDDLMEKLGKYKTGKSCLYIKSLQDIDMKILQSIITQSVDYMKEKYGK
ncbi:DUF1801 domain-containing protein [Chryseotalea sanaruensis]|uniref:DUF1801 domain-containing protein n=1 Tax=Chryseotalea sanaruensis TaxID=2482724 RepID=A0A401U7C4_9BACT|nr:DUF1801 domain-containing protein [Chryseotalea sanaruensis]GCC50786.1 DUF1801 domain-containing protein [Chryseotalea sanaruensis]